MDPRNYRLRRRSIYESSSLVVASNPVSPQRGQTHHRLHHRQRRRFIHLCRPKQQDEDCGDYGGFALEWDDFGDQVIGGSGDIIADSNTGNINEDEKPPENTTIFEQVDEQLLIGGDNDLVVVPSSNTVWSSTRSALSERIQTVQITEQKQTARLARNWNLGNWQVRGFVLPPPGNETWSSMNVTDGSTATTLSAVVTQIVQVVTSGSSSNTNDDDDDDDDNINDLVWVARSDGCIFGVRLGTAYMTKLGNDNDNENAAEEDTKPYSPSQQQRLEWSNDNDDDDDDSMNDRIATASSRTRPFEIVARLSMDDPSAAAITSIAVVETDSLHDDVDGSTLVLFAAGPDGTIQKWKVTWKEDVVEDRKGTTRIPLIDPCPTLERALSPHNEVSGTTALALQPIILKSTTGGTDPLQQPQQLLLAVDANSLTLWDCESGTLQGHIRVTSPLDDGRNPIVEQDPVVTSAHANGVHIYVGTRSGHVVAYTIMDVLQQASTTTMSPVLPAGQWRASNDPITAIACGGAGTLGRGRSEGSKTTVLYTGDGNGMVKQWEVFTTASKNVEAWPKLATQRLPKKAHIFSGHYGAVTAIRTIDSVKFVTAANDGTVRVWNSASGKEMCRMDGFTHSLRSLCLFDGDNKSNDVVPSSVATRNALSVTDGMDNCVCVHDFSVDNEDDDFDLEMPEYR